MRFVAWTPAQFLSDYADAATRTAAVHRLTVVPTWSLIEPPVPLAHTRVLPEVSCSTEHCAAYASEQQRLSERAYTLLTTRLPGKVQM